MQLLCRVEQLLSELRPAFNRQAAFEWFVILMWGVLLCTQFPAVTSYLNAVGLSEYYYQQALHWFHSKSWTVVKISLLWQKSLLENAHLHQLNSQAVYIGDGIKVSKEGRRMPGVKTTTLLFQTMLVKMNGLEGTILDAYV